MALGNNAEHKWLDCKNAFLLGYGVTREIPTGT